MNRECETGWNTEDELLVSWFTERVCFSVKKVYTPIDFGQKKELHPVSASAHDTSSALCSILSKTIEVYPFLSLLFQFYRSRGGKRKIPVFLWNRENYCFFLTSMVCWIPKHLHDFVTFVYCVKFCRNNFLFYRVLYRKIFISYWGTCHPGVSGSY